MNVVYAAHRRPVLRAAQRGHRERRLIGALAVRLVSGHHGGGGVRRKLQRVVVAWPLAGLDARGLDADGDHRHPWWLR